MNPGCWLSQTLKSLTVGPLPPLCFVSTLVCAQQDVSSCPWLCTRFYLFFCHPLDTKDKIFFSFAPVWLLGFFIHFVCSVFCFGWNSWLWFEYSSAIARSLALFQLTKLFVQNFVASDRQLFVAFHFGERRNKNICGISIFQLCLFQFTFDMEFLKLSMCTFILTV